LNDLSRREYARLYRYLDLAGGVIFTVDGAMVIEACDVEARRGVASPQLRAAQMNELSIIDTISRRFRARGERVPAALVVTKADVFWDRPEWTLFRADSDAGEEALGKATRELLLKAGRQALVSAIEEVFAPVRYCTVSAFGHVPLGPLRAENLAPARVEEPLMALLGLGVTR
jgi:hypothetical protein